jgi:DNA/RNA-binding domain of Phe-tRNA-synthetase-like protein
VSGVPPPEPVVGWQAAEVERELPGVRLLISEVEVGRPEPLTADSPPDIEARLREFSSRVRGARAITLRREPVPAAYRIFFRHIGMDPDVDRTPIEAAVMERMLKGGFLSGGLLDDILLIAMLDTGVPVWALDAEQLDGPLGIRAATDAEALGRSTDPPLLPSGRLVIADSSSPVAILFGALAPGHQARAATRRLALFAIQVPGVPELFAEEALWTAATALQAG